MGPAHFILLDHCHTMICRSDMVTASMRCCMGQFSVARQCRPHGLAHKSHPGPSLVMQATLCWHASTLALLHSLVMPCFEGAGAGRRGAAAGGGHHGACRAGQPRRGGSQRPADGCGAPPPNPHPPCTGTRAQRQTLHVDEASLQPPHPTAWDLRAPQHLLAGAGSAEVQGPMELPPSQAWVSCMDRQLTTHPAALLVGCRSCRVCNGAGSDPAQAYTRPLGCITGCHPGVKGGSCLSRDPSIPQGPSRH